MQKITKNKTDKLLLLLDSHEIENIDDIIYHIDTTNFEEYQTLDDLNNDIIDNNLLDVDIIYQETALEYLIKNDPSLQKSISIADNYGFMLNNVNSELLATLLATQINIEKWNNEELQEELKALLFGEEEQQANN